MTGELCKSSHQYSGGGARGHKGHCPAQQSFIRNKEKMFSQTQFNQVETERSNSSLPAFNNQDLDELKNYPDSYSEVFQLSEDQSHLIQDLDLSQYSFKREQFYNFTKSPGDGLNYNAGEEELYHNSNDPYFVSGFSTESPGLTLKDGDWTEAGVRSQF